MNAPVDLPTFAVDLAIQLTKSLEAEQIAHRATQEALVETENDRGRWIRRHRSAVRMLLVMECACVAVLIVAVWGWVR